MSSNLSAQNLFTVDGCVAVVTGGGSGIGAMIARALAANGASAIYILGLPNDPLDEVAREASRSNIYPIVCDVTSKEHLQLAVDKITQETGHINLLICNAGMATPQYETHPTETSSIQEVREYYFNTLQVEEHAAAFNLNTTAVLLTTFAFLELLDAGNKVNEAANASLPRSQVVTVSSAGGFFRGYGDFVYNATKAATTHMMKHMATALVPWDIRCNVIAPGWFPSRITAKLIKEFEPAGGLMPKALVPAQRIGAEEEMAGTILYLASKAGGYCNGSVVLVDGGVLSIHPSTY
ncbi:short chain dehydrogenase/reductase [Stipitochalara longipes BDJ]|nr:short chain dehydrogenase/reductase [Stipitochalara longipes BDJ]